MYIYEARTLKDYLIRTKITKKDNKKSKSVRCNRKN